MHVRGATTCNTLRDCLRACVCLCVLPVVLRAIRAHCTCQKALLLPSSSLPRRRLPQIETSIFLSWLHQPASHKCISSTIITRSVHAPTQDAFLFDAHLLSALHNSRKHAMYSFNEVHDIPSIITNNKEIFYANTTHTGERARTAKMSPLFVYSE